MQYAESILDLVGRTPLVRITRLVRDLGPADDQPLILAKLEMLNPGGSVKDRIGLPMIEAAEREGKLKPGGTIIEPTSGNTGHGLAIAAAIKGYRCIFVMADKQSAEKQALLRAYGAEVVLCPTNVAPESPESYYSVAARLARDIPGAFKPDQYWNEENPKAHERTTGPEIWEQTDGRITHLVASVGTGGTVAGRRTSSRRATRRSGSLGPTRRAASCRATTSGRTSRRGSARTSSRAPTTRRSVDRWVRVSDRDAFAMARRITREEGILAGESCGTAMVAARDVVARAHRRTGGRDAVVVVILPDGGRNYLSKLYNDEWMRMNGLMRRPRAPSSASAELLRRPHHGARSRTSSWLARRSGSGTRSGCSRSSGSARCPCRRTPTGRRSSRIVGSISEKGLLDRAFRDPSVVERTVGEVMDRPLPLVADGASLDEAFALLSGGANALIATRGDRPVGVVTKLDLLEFLSHFPNGRG